MVVAKLLGNDVILCQITSQLRDDAYSIPLLKESFQEGNLPVASFIRPNRLFTADKEIIIYKAGSLGQNKITEVKEKLVEIFAA